MAGAAFGNPQSADVLAKVEAGQKMDGGMTRRFMSACRFLPNGKAESVLGNTDDVRGSTVTQKVSVKSKLWCFLPSLDVKFSGDVQAVLRRREAGLQEVFFLLKICSAVTEGVFVITFSMVL